MINQLRLVEIELFSYCNRKCNWCPNREIDRHSENVEIDDSVLTRLLSELKESGYKGPITFSRYNEPFSHMEIFKKRLHQIREVLPDNKLITNSNGDFLCMTAFDGLELDELTVMDYDRKGLTRCIEILENCDAKIDEVAYPCIYAHKGNTKLLYFVNWLDKKTITDRGGFLKEYSQQRRMRPCYEPQYFVGINYDGTVSPCCNVRNDIPTMQPYILGDLHNSSLKEILETEKSEKFHKLCAKGVYMKDSPCYYCDNKGGRYTQGGQCIRYE